MSRSILLEKVCSAAVLLAIALAGTAGADPLYWNNDGSSVGPWDNGVSTTPWRTATGSLYDSLWVGGSDAHFEGAAGGGPVEVSGTIESVNSITFDVADYVLGGTGTLTLTGAGGVVTTTSGSQEIAAALAGAVGLTKAGPGTLRIAGTTSYTGPTTAAGGTLQFTELVSPNRTTDSIVLNGGDITIADSAKLTPTGAAGITFSSTNAINKTASTGALGFVSTTSTLAVTVAPGATGTIGVDFAGTGIAGGDGNKISKLGSGKLVLPGNTVLVGDSNIGFTAGFSVEGGGELEITGALKAASYLQSNKGNYTNLLGATSGNNTLTISGASGTTVYAGGMTVGGHADGGNSIVISRPGTQAVPSYKMAGNGSQLNLGVSSSNNSLTVSDGAYVYQAQGGGTNTWFIGVNAGANNNSILITGAGSTIDRTGVAGSAINVGVAGSGNSITIEAGGKLRPRRLAIGTNGGGNNFIHVTGAGSLLDGNDSQPSFAIGSDKAINSGATVGSSGNYLLVEDGGSAIFDSNQNRGYNVGAVTGADNNYVRVDGASSVFTMKQGQPFAIGGATGSNNGNHYITDSLASGNHLDVWNGATTNQNSVYVMGVNSAFNLGNGSESISQAYVGLSGGNAMYSPGITLYNDTARLNINNGRLVATTAGNLVSGTGQIVLNGPAYINTGAFTSPAITTRITGSGSLIKEGDPSANPASMLTLTSPLNDYTGDTIVAAGILRIQYDSPNRLSDAGAVKIAAGAFMDLNFTGTETVGSLWLGGTEMAAGIYNSSTPTWGSYFTGIGFGSGSLQVGGSSTPTDYVWTSEDSSSWIAGANWDGGTAPDGAGFTVTVGNADTQGTISVDGERTLGQLTFSGDIPVTIGGPESLIFSKGSLSEAKVIVDHGTTHADTLSAPIYLNNSLVVQVNNSADTLTIDGGIEGDGKSLTLDAANAGTVILGGSNIYDGGTVVLGGTLKIASAGALPAGKSLSIGSGGTLVLGGGMAMGTAAQSAEPVPEPGTLALLAAAAVALLLVVRRR